MNIRWTAVGVLAMMLLPAIGARADASHRAFFNGIAKYNDKKFAEAAALFSKVAASGIHNGKLYYNLGNAYLKAGQLGEAMLWYERADRLIHGDPDLRFNLAYARSLLRDKSEGQRSPIERIVFFWRYWLSQASVQWTAIGLNLIFWLLLALRLFFKQRISKLAAGAVLALSLVFVATAGYNGWASKHVLDGVILPREVSVRSGLTDASTELFRLHAGSLVRIQNQIGDYLQIRYSAGKIGWLKRASVGIV
jgi:tetratricopeptide (TPR) repeat protein